MLKYLNTNNGYEDFLELLRYEDFIDKSKIIEKLNKSIGTKRKYICITRPRRFGKSSIVDMLGAYYTKSINSQGIFDKLNISKCTSYMENLNKYNVIKIDFSELPDERCNYDEYINMIKSTIMKDIKSIYNEIDIELIESIPRILEETNDKFIFIFDEWDFIFNRGLFKENQDDFLEFLRGLLKDKSYVALAYMTGILPIKKFTSFISPTNNLCCAADYSVAKKHSFGSALNMFEEFTFLKDRKFEEYFGFTEEEVKELCTINGDMKYEELERWYNGYMTATGIKVYNPRSVVLALANDYCQSYWTNTGAMDEVLEYLKYNILDVRDDVIRMVNGDEVEIEIDEEYRAGQGNPKSREEVYSAMIVLGFLSYYEGLLKIPNNELMKEFKNAL
ncbi:MAG: AAA family ATPase [Peptostreptococcaceae bacterium]